MAPHAHAIVERLRLEPLPLEGGFFRQTWRDPAGSAIYFLLTPENFSALHRLAQPELWHFYAGDPVEHVRLSGAGAIRTRLGPNILAGEAPQLLVPAGAWQGARSAVGDRFGPPSDNAQRDPAQAASCRHCGWSLLGCTLAPPWDERGFELGERAVLLRQFPAAAEIIRALTR